VIVLASNALHRTSRWAAVRSSRGRRSRVARTGALCGRDAALAETKRLTEWGENRYTDIDVVADEGNWVVVAFRWHVRGAGSGIATQLDVAVAVRVKEGRIIEWHNRWSRDEALEAAGLQE
jgi:hypothetical protein